MASLLRSGKFFRYFSNAARNLVFNTGNRSDAEAILYSRRTEWEVNIQRSMTTFQLPLKSILSETEPLPASRELDKALNQANEDIRKLGRIPIKTVENILSSFKELRAANPQQCALIIRCCGSLTTEEHPRNRTNLVHEIWKIIEDANIPIDIVHYNSLLRVYLENEHSFDPMEFLANLKQKNLQPTRVTYQRLVSAYCLKGDLNGASKILEIMKEESMPINENVFNALITGHARIGDLENAKGMINIMQQSGLKPDSESYLALMSGYAQSGELEQLVSTSEECRAKRVFLHHRQWFELLFRAALKGHTAVVDYILSEVPRNTGYNVECLNLIYRLINFGKDETGFKVFQTMNQMYRDSKQNNYGVFFIRQLIKCNRPVNNIVFYCDQIAQQGINPRIYFIALNISNANCNMELTDALISRIKEQKENIHPRVFWSLLDTQGSKVGEKGVLELLSKITSLNVNVNAETISNHVIEHLEDSSNLSSTSLKLKSTGVPDNIVNQSLLLKCLERNDFETACNLISTYDIWMREEQYAAAAKAYATKDDANSFAQLLSTLLKKKRLPKDKSAALERAAQILDPFVLQAVSVKPSPEDVEKLLTTLYQTGLLLSNKVAQAIQTKLDGSMTSTISGLLDKLSSGDSFEWDQHPTQELNNYSNAIKEGDVDAALKLKSEMEGKNFPDWASVVLIDLLVNKEKLNEAWAIFNEANANPNFFMSAGKNLKFANALLKADRVDDAVLVLSKLPAEQAKDSKAVESRAAWRLLNTAVEKGDAELLDKLFGIIKDSQSIPINAAVLSPLIKIHMDKGDLDAAIEVMDDCARDYDVTPMKNQLMVELIKKDDADRLQKVMDTSFKVHGETNSLYDLIFAFLECGRIRQAQKVIETPGLRARKDRLDLVCSRYVEEKRVTELDNLVKITKDVFGVNRMALYGYLLKAYIRTDDVEGARGLWTRLLDDGLRATNSFLHELGEYLKGKDVDPPFVVPPKPEEEETTSERRKKSPNTESSIQTRIEEVDEKPSTSKEKTEATGAVKPRSSTRKAFSSAIAAEDVEEALRLKETASRNDEKLGVMDLSKLIALVLKKGQLDVATPLVKEMLENDSYPVPFVFRIYAFELAKSGDKENLEYLDKKLNPGLKRAISFNGALASTWNRDSTSINAHLDGLIQEIDHVATITNEEEKFLAVNKFEDNVNRSLLISLLSRNPEFLEKCKELSEKALKQNIVKPSSSLWLYHLCNGQKEEADSYWNIIKNHAGVIPFRHATNQCLKTGNVELGRNLVETLSTSQYTTKGALGLAYSAWVDAHTTNENTIEALSVLEEALSKDIKLEEIRRETLERLKKQVTSSGKNFPYIIPAKKPRNTQDTSSDSD